MVSMPTGCQGSSLVRSRAGLGCDSERESERALHRPHRPAFVPSSSRTIPCVPANGTAQQRGTGAENTKQQAVSDNTQTPHLCFLKAKRHKRFILYILGQDIHIQAHANLLDKSIPEKQPFLQAQLCEKLWLCHTSLCGYALRVTDEQMSG